MWPFLWLPVQTGGCWKVSDLNAAQVFVSSPFCRCLPCKAQLILGEFSVKLQIAIIIGLRELFYYMIFRKMQCRITSLSLRHWHWFHILHPQIVGFNCLIVRCESEILTPPLIIWWLLGIWPRARQPLDYSVQNSQITNCNHLTHEQWGHMSLSRGERCWVSRQAALIKSMKKSIVQTRSIAFS